MIRKLALTVALLAPTSALAQDLPTAPYLPLDMAQTAARARPWMPAPPKGTMSPSQSSRAAA